MERSGKILLQWGSKYYKYKTLVKHCPHFSYLKKFHLVLPLEF